MLRFLLAVWSFETHVDPFLAVGSALREQGHDVAFYAGPRASKNIAAQGFRIFPFTALDEQLADSAVADIVADRASPRKLRNHWYRFLISQLPKQVQDLEAIVNSWNPSVIVSDMAMAGPFTVFRELSPIPVAILSHVGYSMSPGPQGPVPGRAFPPHRHGVSALHAWMVRAVANYVTRDVPRGIDQFRKSVGLPATGLRIVDYYGRAPLFLIPTVPKLDYERTDLPSSVAYTGPCFWPPVVRHAPETKAPQKLRIVVDEGSLHTDHPTLLRASIEAFKNTDCDLILISGRSRAPGLVSVPPGSSIRLLPWKPVNEELAGTSLLISTGNTESVLSGLSRGIPVLIAPSILDQSELAWRAKWVGAGEFIAERELSPELIRKTALQILNDPKYRAGAQNASALLKQHQGAREAARLLGELAAKQMSPETATRVEF